jgi:hypothetical protein
VQFFLDVSASISFFLMPWRLLAPRGAELKIENKGKKMHRLFRLVLFLFSVTALLSCVPLDTYAETPTVSMPALATASEPAFAQRSANPTETQAQQLADENDIFLPVVTEEVANPQPALKVTKTVTSSGTYELNSQITYSIVVKNTGNITLTGVAIADPGAVLGSCTPSIPASILTTKSVTCTATHTVTQADLNRGYFINVATADSDQTGSSQASVRVNFSQNSEGFIADHRVIAEFDSIPKSAIDAAAAKKTLFYHASTGGNIHGLGLECLAGINSDPGYYPAECVIYASNPGVGYYNIANWNWPEYPNYTTDAVVKMDQFVSLVSANQQNYDVIGMKYCYVDAWNQDFDQYQAKMEALESQYPNKVFIWATSAIYSQSSTSCTGEAGTRNCGQIENFNTQVRAYINANNKPLYDIAAIESNGGDCTKNGFEALCAEYSDGLGGGGGGHPDTDGSIRLAKGFWWLMAKISGWN